MGKKQSSEKELTKETREKLVRLSRGEYRTEPGDNEYGVPLLKKLIGKSRASQNK